MEAQKYPVTLISIHGLIDPNDPQGRTYKQINATNNHAIPIGALVEDTDTGVRLFVAKHTRDCDMTPLYSLSPYPHSEEDAYRTKYKRVHGYSEEHLEVINVSPMQRIG